MQYHSEGNILPNFLTLENANVSLYIHIHVSKYSLTRTYSLGRKNSVTAGSNCAEIRPAFSSGTSSLRMLTEAPEAQPPRTWPHDFQLNQSPNLQGGSMCSNL